MLNLTNHPSALPLGQEAPSAPEGLPPDSVRRRERPRRLPRVLAVFIAALTFTGVAQATTYYVSPSGADTNSGTSTGSPWRTVSKASSFCASPGDKILFQGGQSFGDSSLNPACSGTSATPVTYGSYGSGLASLTQGVWMSGGQHDLVFDSLDLTSSSSNIFMSSGGGAAANDITLQNSVVHDTPYVGVYGQPQDTGWKILNTTIRHTGDSGIINQSPGLVVSGSTITDTGYAGLSYGTHGIYGKAPNMTITNNDFSANHGGQAVSIRMHGTVVSGNTIHDTSYGIAFFNQDPQNSGTFYVYDNRFWNISGYVFYYSPNGVTSAINAVWDSNTALVSGGGEAVNLSEMQSAAWAEVKNNIFSGSIGSGYRGCGTCSEGNNDWYGVTSNNPSSSGDQHVAPSLASTPALTPLAGSPVIDHGALSSRVSYHAVCDGATLDYCGSMPDQGGVEYGVGGSGGGGGGDTTPPSPPGGLALSGVTTSAGTLAWTTPYDNVGVTGYDVYLNGQALTSTTGLSYAFTGLSCGASYTVGVDAYDAAGNYSSVSSMTLSTLACPIGPTVTITSPAANAKTPLSLTATATASSDVTRVAFYLDGVLVGTDTTPTWSFPVTVKKGWHTLSVVATGTGGLQASAQVRFQAMPKG